MAASNAGVAIDQDTTHKLIVAQAHVGAENVDCKMERYVWGRRVDGQNIINLQYTWDKIVLAARIIAAVENPKDVAVVSARDWGQRAVLKFASHTGATPVAGRFTPGTFTNQQQQKDFKEPRLIIVTDTRLDHQPLIEASYVNIPTIAFANTDSNLQYVDVAIPCNNAASQSIGLIYWLLCREVLRIKGKIPRNQEWDVMPDLFFWRDPSKEEEKQQEESNDFSSRSQNESSASTGQFDALSNQSETLNTSTAGQSLTGAWTGNDNSASASSSVSAPADPFPVNTSSSSADDAWTGLA